MSRSEDLHASEPSRHGGTGDQDKYEEIRFVHGFSGRLAFPEHAECRVRAQQVRRGPSPCASSEDAAPATTMPLPQSETHFETPGLAMPDAFPRVLLECPSTSRHLQRVHPAARGCFGAVRPAPRGSVFVVSHHPDGFRHRGLRGLVASRSRSWGSSGCTAPGHFKATARPDSHRCLHPPELSPPAAAVGTSPCFPAPWAFAGHEPARLRGLDPPGSPLRRHHVAVAPCPRLSWVSLSWSSCSPAVSRQGSEEPGRWWRALHP
jgi:hypothetical protein